MTRKQIPPKTLIIKNFDGDNVPEDFEFPSIGIEDIDRALFDLFDKKLDFQVTSNGKTIDVPVIFATGERFALTRRKSPIRDKNNANILPLISIVRNNFDISPSQGGKGTAIAFRAQPNYTVKYRLSEKDRSYQNILNKNDIKNQKNVANETSYIDTSNKIGVKPDALGTRRNTENLQFSKNAQISLKPEINTNMYEIIQTPYPYFITTTYNITMWCQYLVQANQMLEYFLSKIDVPGGEFAIKTEDGYELVAFVGNNINFENNFDSMTEDERIIKYSFDITIPGYLLNLKTPGLPNQLRSFFSAPTIDFGYYSTNSNVRLDYQPETKKETIERHVLTDLTSVKEDILYRGESNEVIETYIQNPFSNNKEAEFLRIKNSNSRTGETVLSQRIIKEIDRQYE